MHNAKFIVPNAFTGFNFLLGVASICFSAGLLGNDPGVVWGAHLIIYCALLDKMDGFAARAFNASSEFGAQFDSLADLIAFGIAPAFMIMFSYKNLSPEWYELHKLELFAGAAIYMVCTAMRLAKYNAMDSESYPDYFSGMPSTFAGIVNALIIILLNKYEFFNSSHNTLYIPLVIMLLTSILMVSPLFLAKLKKRKSLIINAFQVVNIAGAYIAGFARILPEYLMALVLIYFSVGFTHGLINRNKIISSHKEGA